jgi:hypothetical protein
MYIGDATCNKILEVIKTKEYQTIGVNIGVEIFDLDMRETIWPMPGDEDPGIWLPKEAADKYNDNQIGRWFLNRYLIDYGNSYEFTVIRRVEKIMTSKRWINESQAI